MSTENPLPSDVATVENKVQGCLLGQAIGDALGTTYEFSRSDMVIEQMSHFTISGFVVIVGGGPFNLSPGQVTDDTEMALALSRSILREGRFDREKVSKAYIEWYHSPPFDIGRTTRNALQGAKCFTDMVFNARDLNTASMSNGSLMRASPLAILGLRLTEDELRRCCVEDTLMTHSHPNVVDATQVYVLAIRDALLGLEKIHILERARGNAQSRLVKDIVHNSLESPYPDIVNPITGGVDKRVKNDERHIGYFGIALQNALYELMNGTSFYDSLVAVVKRGGDTDTNAAICGSLLGAYYGASEMPEMWKETIINGGNQNRLQSYPWADTYDILSVASRLWV